MNDILQGKNLEVKIGEHGVVKLIDCMPRLIEISDYEWPEFKNFDHAVCQAARVSYGQQEKKTTPKEDRGLIRYLWRKHHGTPFEMVDVKFYIAMPIFVMRQMIRHRTASVNEYSMRYKSPKEKFFIPEPDEIRKQAKNNKQGSEGQVDEQIATEFCEHTMKTAMREFSSYEGHAAQGIGREIARINLPLTTFTECYWEIDLRNLLGFLALRRDKHAQKEIRDYAEALWSLILPLAPWSCEAFEDFTFGAVTLTKLEVETIKAARSSDAMKILGDRATDRERDEWEEKRRVLFGA